MKIKCKDKTDFMDVVESCVRRNLGFNADTETLTITFTGGY